MAAQLVRVCRFLRPVLWWWISAAVPPKRYRYLLNGVVYPLSVRIGGDHRFDEAIINYVRRNYAGSLIGEAT